RARDHSRGARRPGSGQRAPGTGGGGRRSSLHPGRPVFPGRGGPGGRRGRRPQDPDQRAPQRRSRTPKTPNRRILRISDPPFREQGWGRSPRGGPEPSGPRRKLMARSAVVVVAMLIPALLGDRAVPLSARSAPAWDLSAIPKNTWVLAPTTYLPAPAGG